jgi:hypothetical protein
MSCSWNNGSRSMRNFDILSPSCNNLYFHHFRIPKNAWTNLWRANWLICRSWLFDPVKTASILMIVSKVRRRTTDSSACIESKSIFGAWFQNLDPIFTEFRSAHSRIQGFNPHPGPASCRHADIRSEIIMQTSDSRIKAQPWLCILVMLKYGQMAFAGGTKVERKSKALLRKVLVKPVAFS